MPVVEPNTRGISTTPIIAQIDDSPVAVEPIPTPEPAMIDGSTNSSLLQFDEFSLKQGVSIVTTILLLLTLILDLTLAESHKLSRRVGKNWAHIIFINVILILVTIVQAGRIL